MRRTLWFGLVLVLVTGCAQATERTPRTTAAAPTTDGTASATTRPTTTTGTTTPTTTKPKPAPNVKPTPRPTTPRPSATGLTSLRGDTRNAIAWAPLSNPADVHVEGSVPSYRAWSTSKVLVVAAYLDTVVDGDPSRIPARERGWIKAALTASDGDAVVAIRNEIPGRPGPAIDRVLRSIGDTTTSAPDTSQGSMQWKVRQQLRFMAALHSGRVVSPEASAFLLGQMHPIAAHRWGLGRIGAGAFKGGWLRADTETRQMGIVGGYAVAIITAGDGPAVLQTDGDSAHVQQMDRLAALLATRLR
ncbi:hypothetical protein RKE38_07945 [Phycicoccus sp. M110.8]|uniref:hypothetical protein n=1 Tax=Phycicoccus sp. M110.8 TaxID=3075433 RepID=UPI0028FD03D8|nr:hypothetical protein [Phycicoccus sp. M110.8]MDU0313617.1 hypothetical protein [Phycicoccus sp. M110.8]